MKKINDSLEWMVGGVSVTLAVILLVAAGMLVGSTLMEFIKLHSFGAEALRPVVLGVLNTLVLLELVRLFLRIEKEHVFQAPLLIDTGLVFVTREILVSLYDHNKSSLALQLAVFAAFVVARMLVSRTRST